MGYHGAVIETGTYVDEELQAGVLLCRSGDWKRGVEVLSRLAREREDELPGVALSYLGRGLAVHKRRIGRGLELCRRAAKEDFYQPEVYLNLGHTALVARRRSEAWRAVEAGLELDADHRGLLELRREMGDRRPPVLRFLSRKNPLNVLLGRLRHALKR